MPELYAGIASKLKANFIYLTGSPYQIYPFLRKFIGDTYPTARGPIFAKNLTIVDIPEAIRFLTESSAQTFEHKLSVLNRVHSMYPNKKFLTVGDSTQKDPEVYAEM